MMGVLKRLPYTPSLNIVNDPPAISCIDKDPSFAFFARVLISFSLSAKFILSPFQITGTTRPRGGNKLRTKNIVNLYIKLSETYI